LAWRRVKGWCIRGLSSHRPTGITYTSPGFVRWKTVLRFERSLLPIVVMDGETQRNVDCNPAAATVYGMSSVADTLGKAPSDLSLATQYDGTPSAEKATYYIDIARRQGPLVFEWRHKRPNGTLWDAEVHLLAFQEGDREFFQFSLVDITERKLVDKLQRIQRDLVLQLNACTDIREGLTEVLEAVMQLEYIDCPERTEARSAELARWRHCP